MVTPNYTPEQISALRALRDRLRSAQYTWEVRQLLKNTASATGLKQLQLMRGSKVEVAILLIEVFWSRKEADQRHLLRLIRFPKCYIDSPEGSGGEYTVERLAEGRNCEQLVDMISRFRELCPQDTGAEEADEAEEEETEEERASATERMRRLQRLSTPIPRTPSPPSPTSSNGSLEPANFSPLHVFTPKKKTPLNLHAARQPQGHQILHFGIPLQNTQSTQITQSPIQSQIQSGRNKEQGFRDPQHHRRRVVLCLRRLNGHLNLSLRLETVGGDGGSLEAWMMCLDLCDTMVSLRPSLKDLYSEGPGRSRS
ncbi:hypothetical protein B0T13DRAFT_500743 [Neurospora crassa]|nr:hypothetical protein B0T13DRAFT_500743 [Neurospora crassa]